MSLIVDIHPHAIAPERSRYGRAPVGGAISSWGRDRPVPIETLIGSMDAAGVDVAALVHASTVYGYDNSYVLDCADAYANRIVSVGALDVLANDAPQQVDRWTRRGIAGFRIFAAGSTLAVGSGGWLDSSLTFRAWEAVGASDLPLCVQTTYDELPRLVRMLERFPHVTVILDHCAMPPTETGLIAQSAPALFALAQFPQLTLKLTEHLLGHLDTRGISRTEFVGAVVAAFGADRIAWGSNFPASSGSLDDILMRGRAATALLSASEQAKIFSQTALRLYPKLARIRSLEGRQAEGIGRHRES